MTSATLEHEIFIQTKNQTGMAAKLGHLITEKAHANIKTLWGGVINGKGTFTLITDDNRSVEKLLKNSEFKEFHEEDVLVVLVGEGPGTYETVTTTLGNAGIDINYLYTTMYDHEPAIVVSTTDNKQALSLFK